MRYYQFSSHVYLELFDKDAVLLVADRDLMVTVNHFAAQIFIHAWESVGSGLFSRSDCVNYLLEHYELTSLDAEEQMRTLLGFALQHAIIMKKHTV